MKKKSLFTFLSAIMLLTSCGNAKKIRSDIKEFIASFSLAESMEKYKNISYIEHWEGFKDNVLTNKNITVDFDIRDEVNPSYSYHEIVVENEKETSNIFKLVYKENEQLIYEENGEKSPCEYSKCLELVITLFYTSVQLDGLYHSGGMYIGDYILEMALTIQDYLEVDSENNVLKFHRDYDNKDPLQPESLNHTYYVDAYGMMYSFSYHQVSKTNYINQTISLSQK